MTRRAGFTLIELTITIVVAALLLAIVGRAMGSVRERLATQQAQKTYEALHARARAHAIEQGRNARVILDVNGDSAFIVKNGQTVETVHFDDEFGVDVRSAAKNPIVVCMNSRGYADESCTSFSSTIQIGFYSRSDTAAIHIRPLGQIVR